MSASLADLIRACGLSPATLVTDLPGITWHITKPLKAQDVVTLAQLRVLSDEAIEAIPGIGPRRLGALKDAVRGATA